MGDILLEHTNLSHHANKDILAANIHRDLVVHLYRKEASDYDILALLTNALLHQICEAQRYEVMNLPLLQ